MDDVSMTTNIFIFLCTRHYDRGWEYENKKVNIPAFKELT